jgi:thiaminase
MTSLPLHSPAELLLLLHKRHKPSLRQLLRVTFLDLLRQQVLVISREPVQPHPSDPISWQEYVMAGTTLASYAARPHEKLLFDTFRFEDQLRIPFRHYVRMILQKANSAADYNKLIEANERTGQLFSQHWLLHLLSARRLTPSGEQFKATTEAELLRLDKEFVAKAAQDPADAHLFMQQLAGAMFLLPSFTSEVGRQLERELQRIPETTYSTYGDFGGGSDSSTCWNTHGDSFDSHCGDDGNSGGGDSGCGSDGGCSGCGGCGGD